MARLNVNPTRMVLTNLKRKLRTARRGHKLLKDKRDELMKKFLAIVKENRRERELVEKMLKDVYSRFIMARALMSDTHLEEALIFPKQKVTLKASSKNIMSVEVPVFEFYTQGQTGDDVFPYGFAATSGELDGAMIALQKVTPHLLRLAELEKTAQLMADEIEKTRRRGNALEYVMIPNIEETIKYIVMKLDENERGNMIRLMKVKDMMLEEAHHFKERMAQQS